VQDRASSEEKGTPEKKSRRKQNQTPAPEKSPIQEDMEKERVTLEAKIEASRGQGAGEPAFLLLSFLLLLLLLLPVLLAFATTEYLPRFVQSS